MLAWWLRPSAAARGRQRAGGALPRSEALLCSSVLVQPTLFGKGELDSCPYNFQKLEICPYNSRNWRFALHILALPELWPFLHMKPSWTHLQHLYVCIGPKCPPRQEEKGEANG